LWKGASSNPHVFLGDPLASMECAIIDGIHCLNLNGEGYQETPRAPAGEMEITLRISSY
jgi:hypothetical protein